MRALLDTQAILIPALTPEQAPKHLRELLEDRDSELFVSSASLVEIALKNSIGKIDVPEGLAREAMEDMRLSILSFDARHAYAMFSLPMHHRDPFDRMIIATALAEKLPVVTGDRAFKRYKLTVIW